MTISAKARHRVVVLLTSVALALALLLTGAVVARADSTPEPTGFITHTVTSGDTLWEIAGDHAAPGDDLRNVVEDIKRFNALGSSVITPGQVLRIPLGS
jgi:LysM repeat protein